MKQSKPINAANVPDFRYRKETDLEQTFKRVRERMKVQEQESKTKVRKIGVGK